MLKNTSLHVAFLLFLWVGKFSLPAQTFDLATAIESKMISTTIIGNDDSPHYNLPLLIALSNRTDKAIEIRIANGQLFHSDSTDVQDVILVKEELISVAPRGTASRALTGLCIQQTNRSPGSEYGYKVGKLATGNLAALATEIERRKNFNTLGQYAVWALTDNNDLNDISGFDMEEALFMKTFVAKLLQVPVPDYDENDYRYNYHNTGLIKRAATGKFKFTINEESSVTIAMFDEDGIVVRELYNNPNETSGTHELEFRFDVDVYRNKAYFVRMIVDGEIKIDMKMEPRGS
jgi:hypothetical protein